MESEKSVATYGYVRVSTRDQNEDRQIIALHDQGISDPFIFIDKQSGKDFDRPQYKKLLRRIRKDDVLFIKSIDRLGRNYEEIQNQWRYLTKERGADICVIDMPLLDTRREKNLLGTFVSDIVLQVLSFAAENERINIRQRQAEGIAAARKRGVHMGRPVIEAPDGFAEIVKKWEKKQVSLEEALKMTGMSESTFYRRRRECQLLNNK